MKATLSVILSFTLACFNHTRWSEAHAAKMVMLGSIVHSVSARPPQEPQSSCLESSTMKKRIWEVKVKPTSDFRPVTQGSTFVPWGARQKTWAIKASLTLRSVFAWIFCKLHLAPPPQSTSAAGIFWKLSNYMSNNFWYLVTDLKQINFRRWFVIPCLIMQSGTGLHQ